MKKVYYIQPLVPEYRRELVDRLNEAFDLTVCSNTSASDKGGFKSGLGSNIRSIVCGKRRLFGDKLYSQLGWMFPLFRDRPHIIIHGMDLREVGIYFLPFVASFLKCKIVWHGQGVYKHISVGFLRRKIVKFLISRSVFYIAYNDLSKSSLVSIGVAEDKIFVANNSLQIDEPLLPAKKKGIEDGILFVGRLRESNGLCGLIDVLKKIRDEHGYLIKLHVVGSGDDESFLKSRYGEYDWIAWHGKVYDHQEIRRISMECRIGCHPGDAGLSVVHFFGLSLPPVVHNVFQSHMGPEPFYVKDRINGFSFNKTMVDLERVILDIWEMPTGDYVHVCEEAYATYVMLNSPTLGSRFVELLNGIEQ